MNLEILDRHRIRCSIKMELLKLNYLMIEILKNYLNFQSLKLKLNYLELRLTRVVEIPFNGLSFLHKKWEQR